MEQKAPLDVWAKYGADQHKVCGTWEAGFRPVIAAHSMLNYSQPLLGVSCTVKCRSAVCLMVCMALHGAARSRKALCSSAKSECPVRAPLAAGFSPSFYVCALALGQVCPVCELDSFSSLPRMK